MINIVTLLLWVFVPLYAFGETVTLAAGLTVEPYIIQTNDSEFEADIVRDAFALEGYKVQFVYQPLLRTKNSFLIGVVDGVMTIQNHYPEIQNTFVSDEYITYHNFAITLQSRNIKINTIADLKGKYIDAFQQAKFALGNEFGLMADNNPEYREMPNQKLQIAKLFLKRNDVIVLDRRIFEYYRQELKSSPGNMMEQIFFEEPITFHNLFKSSSYRMAFQTSKVRDSFNIGLKKLQESGRYKQIIESYVKE